MRGSRAHCRSRRLSQPTAAPNSTSPIRICRNVAVAVGSEKLPVDRASTAKR